MRGENEDDIKLIISTLRTELRSLAYAVESQVPKYVGASGLAKSAGLTVAEIRRLSNAGVLKALPTARGSVPMYDRRKSLKAINDSMAAGILKESTLE